MQPFAIGSKTVSIFPSSEPGAPIIYLNTFSGEGQKIFETTQATGCPPFTLVAISDLDWNHDMTPWDNPPIFKNAEPCTGVVQTIISGCLRTRSSQQQRRRFTEPLVGEGSPGTLWLGCLRCMPSTRPTCFPEWAVCLAPSGFPA